MNSNEIKNILIILVKHLPSEKFVQLEYQADQEPISANDVLDFTPGIEKFNGDFEKIWKI